MHHPDEIEPCRADAVCVDAASLRLLHTVDQYLTPEDWADAAAAGRVPGVLGPQGGRIFARAFGTGDPAARWYSLTPAEAAADPWPCGVVPMSSRWSGRLNQYGGEDCERALAWCTERDLRVPPAGWVPDAAATAQRAPWSVVRGPALWPAPAVAVLQPTHEPPPAPSHVAVVVPVGDHVVAPQSERPHPIPTLVDFDDPEACEDAPAPSPQSERMRAMLHDRPPAAAARLDWCYDATLMGGCMLALFAFALLVGVCS